MKLTKKQLKAIEAWAKTDEVTLEQPHESYVEAVYEKWPAAPTRAIFTREGMGLAMTE